MSTTFLAAVKARAADRTAARLSVIETNEPSARIPNEDPSFAVCAAVHSWLKAQQHAEPFFCDKEALDAELRSAMDTADKKERKALTKSFEARRKELEVSAHAIGAAELPGLAERLRALHTELQPALRAAEAHCLRRRSPLAAMPEEATRAEACRVFYDGTSDRAFSNFMPHRFAIGRLGFLKGEQLFHVAKALVCGDVAAAQRMLTTTGGPALRRLGREVEGYVERGGLWEEVDSGLLLLVCVIIKMAQLQPEHAEVNAGLRAELVGDGRALREGRLLYIAEGAKDDDRCGIGIHAEDVAVLRDATAWGRNQLGHACMLVAEWAAEEVAGRLAGNV